MNFYTELDLIMKQDFGGRGLLKSLPANPGREAALSLLSATRVILLTGFPVRLSDGSFVGETDGPPGTANLACTLLELGCEVHVVTDAASYGLMKAALSLRAPKASLSLLPAEKPEDFIRTFVHTIAPSHFISLERPGKASDGHFHNMRGEIIDDLVSDSSTFLTETKKSGAVTIAIGDGGNEMGMGYYSRQIRANVPSGDLICTKDSADLVLTCGVSNWWAWGLTACLSHESDRFLLPSEAADAGLLKRIVEAGAVDGCTKKQELTVDALSLETHASVLRQTALLVKKYGLLAAPAVMTA